MPADDQNRPKGQKRPSASTGPRARSGGNQQRNRPRGGRSRPGNRSSAGGESKERSSVAASTRPAKAADLGARTAAAFEAPTVAAPLPEKPKASRAVMIAAVPGVVVAVVVIAIGSGLGAPVVASIVGVVLGGVLWTGVWFGGSRFVLSRLGGAPVEDDDVPRASNLVDGLCASMGLPMPELVLVDDVFRGALAVGRNEKFATLVLTTGMLRALDPVELEGVLAHELSHVKSGDVAAATMAAAVVLPFAALFSGSSELVRRLAGSGREFAADGRAVSVTRYPPGLRDALVKMAAGPPPSTLRGSGTGRVFRWLWTVVPELVAPGSSVGDLDAPVTRVAALDEA